MIPPTLPSQAGSPASEDDFFVALKEGLSDEWTVYAGFHFIGGARLLPGEVDFLLLHRQRGMLFVECKGHGIERSPEGRWYRVFKHRREPLTKSPVAQAAGQAQTVAAELRKRAKQAGLPLPGGELPFVFGHAVAFPFATLSSDPNQLGVEMPRTIAIDRTDYPNLEQKICDVLDAYAANRVRPMPLSPQEFSRFCNEVVHPPMSVVPSLRSRIAAESQQYVRLDERQRLIVSAVAENDRFSVVGPAGTGKSILALELARTWANDQAHRVLLLCFNRFLARRLRSQLDAEGIGSDRVDVRHFHSLCYDAARALGRADDRPGEDADADEQRFYWEEVAAELLFEANAAGLLTRYDAVVVDEGQDFVETWWTCVESCLTAPHEGPLVVFYDPDQAIFGRDSSVPDMFRFRLVENYRNTVAIGDVLTRLGEQPQRPHPEAPEGQAPQVHGQLSPRRTLEVLDALVERLVRREEISPADIVLLTPHRRERSILADRTEIGGIELTDDLFERGGKLLHATISRFKGLEAQVVILLDVDPRDPRCGQRERYVAASRASHALYVFEKHGDWLAPN